MIIPTKLIAGDDWSFSIVSCDYSPADGSTLAFGLRGAIVIADVAGVADGSRWTVDVAATVTATLAAGTYAWFIAITKDGLRATIAQGTVEILANIATAAAGYEARSFAQQVVDKLRALVADSGTRLPIEYQVQGRMFRFQTFAALHEALGHWQYQVAKEKIEAGELPADHFVTYGSFGRSC